VTSTKEVDEASNQMQKRMHIKKQLQAEGQGVEEEEKKEENVEAGPAPQAPENWKELTYKMYTCAEAEWIPDHERYQCKACEKDFEDVIIDKKMLIDKEIIKKNLNLVRRHHCRLCGEIFCDDCSPKVGILLSNVEGFTLLFYYLLSLLVSSPFLTSFYYCSHLHCPLSL
jgi:hypothetical protein